MPGLITDKVGAGGSRLVDISGKDIHKISETGNYYGSNVTGAPDGSGWYFKVFAQNKKDIRIVAHAGSITEEDEGSFYYKSKVNDVWSEWAFAPSKYYVDNSHIEIPEIDGLSPVSENGDLKWVENSPEPSAITGGVFTGAFDVSSASRVFYEDYFEGEPLNLSLSEEKILGGEAYVRAKGGLINAIPEDWSFFGTPLSMSPEQGNELHILFISPENIRITNRVFEIPVPAVFISTWDTTANGNTPTNQIQLPFTEPGDGYPLDITVDWGDGTVEAFNDYAAAAVPHTYPAEGMYQISIVGRFGGLKFNWGTDCYKIRSIEQWGGLIIDAAITHFDYCYYLDTTLVSDIPDLTGVKKLMWLGPWESNINRLEEWDVSGVTSLRYLFGDKYDFNQDISGWDVSNVTDMNSLFFNTEFSHDVSGWNVSKVTDMGWTFSSCQFNHDISGWDVSNVTNMKEMFGYTPFNQTIGNWNTSKVTNMSSMFIGSQITAHPFNQDISGWDTSNVTDMSSMFSRSSFNQPIGNWDTSKVVSMRDMFIRANTLFNQDISTWNISSVTDCTGMFKYNDNFSTENYDKLLAGWSAQLVNPGVVFETKTMYSETSQAARDILTSAPNNWIITDGGVVPASDVQEGLIVNEKVNDDDMLKTVKLNYGDYEPTVAYYTVGQWGEPLIYQSTIEDVPLKGFEIWVPLSKMGEYYDVILYSSDGVKLKDATFKPSVEVVEHTLMYF